MATIRSPAFTPASAAGPPGLTLMTFAPLTPGSALPTLTPSIARPGPATWMRRISSTTGPLICMDSSATSRAHGLISMP